MVIQCDGCKGSGLVYPAFADTVEEARSQTYICPKCNGLGYLPSNSHTVSEGEAYLNKLYFCCGTCHNRDAQTEEQREAFRVFCRVHQEEVPFNSRCKDYI